MINAAALTYFIAADHARIFLSARSPATWSATVTDTMSAIMIATYSPSPRNAWSGAPRAEAFRTAPMNGGATHANPAAPYPAPNANSFVRIPGCHLPPRREAVLFFRATNGRVSQWYWNGSSARIPNVMRTTPMTGLMNGMNAAAARPAAETAGGMRAD